MPYIGHLPLRDIGNESLETFKGDRLAGEDGEGSSPATVNRSLEVVRTVLNRAARVWRHNGKPQMFRVKTGPLLLGHAIEGMPEHYATATIARLVEMANRVSDTRDRTTLLRVVNGERDGKVPQKVPQQNKTPQRLQPLRR